MVSSSSSGARRRWGAAGSAVDGAGAEASARSQRRWRWSCGAEGGTSAAALRRKAASEASVTGWVGGRRKSGVGSVSSGRSRVVVRGVGGVSAEAEAEDWRGLRRRRRRRRVAQEKEQAAAVPEEEKHGDLARARNHG